MEYFDHPFNYVILTFQAVSSIYEFLKEPIFMEATIVYGCIVSFEEIRHFPT